MVYLLDANVFIQAKNLHYGLDFCPAFWDWLLQENKAGKVYSLDKVYDELWAKRDELSDWAKTNKHIFLPLDSGVSGQAEKISSWVISRRPAYKDEAKTEFLENNADYWLIAHAMAAGNITIVTHEIANPDILKRVKIPDVCDAFGVPCISPFDMLRRETARFIL